MFGVKAAGGEFDGGMSGLFLEGHRVVEGGEILHLGLAGFIIVEDVIRGGGRIGGGIAVNCIISNNWAVSSGGGLYLGIANHCIISGNDSPQGGGVYMCTVYDSLLTGNGNTNSIGGTAAGAAYAGQIYNSTICGNFSTTLGAVNATTLANCIVYYNSNGAYADCFGCRMTNSCVTPAMRLTLSPSEAAISPRELIL